MAIEKWQVSRIDDAKDILNHMIKDISKVNEISLTLSQAVEAYNGKCWNSKIDNEIYKKIKSAYKYVYINGSYENGTFSVTVNFPGMKIPYNLKCVYVAEYEKLYTQAGNFRINAKAWQMYAKSYSQLCADYVKKLEADKENLENIVERYNGLLDGLTRIANSLQSETQDAIREARLFYSPIPRLF